MASSILARRAPDPSSATKTMHQTSIDFDICANNHRGNAESVAAFAQGDKEAARMKILAAITEAGAEGLTVDELAIRWGVGNQTISGRFSDLKMKGLIQKSGTRPTRTGSMAGVYVAGPEPIVLAE